jgi:hypothetical protein
VEGELLGGADGLAVALELADEDGLTGALELGVAVAEAPLDDGVMAGELARLRCPAARTNVQRTSDLHVTGQPAGCLPGAGRAPGGR